MNIILIGMSGAGKSTLGVLLAKALGMDFFDTDIAIQRHTGKLLQQIIDDEGTEKFLETEEHIISSLTLENSVIATGGSVVYSEKAMKALKRNSITVYLYVPYDEIQKRLTNITTRGIVIKKGYGIRDVYNERAPLYAMYGDITIDCSNKDIEKCVGEIINIILKYRPTT